MPDLGKAQAFKEKGNQFYKAGNHLDAIQQYRLAVSENPDAPLLRFNLSAAQYEAGQYQECLLAVNEAISRCNPEENEELLSKLWLRKAKCQLNLGGNDLKSAEESAKRVGDFQKSPPPVKKDSKAVEGAANVLGFYSGLLLVPEIHSMIMDLPKYRPSLCTDVCEYYNLGHDTAVSQFDPTVFPSKPTYSFFFGGIGDARHLYATLIGITRNEERKNERTSKYHFTINDIKPHVLARDILICLLLSQLGVFGDEKSAEAQAEENDILSLLFYIYVGVLMPARVHSHLVRLINTARNALEGKNDSLPKWLWVSGIDNKAIINVYNSWSGPALTIMSTQQTQAEISDSGRMAPPSHSPKGCEREHASYKRTGMLWPPEAVRKEHEPRVDNLIAGNESGWEKRLKSWVGKKWKINVTLVDEDWFRRAGVWDVSFDPFRIAEHFYEKSGVSPPKDPKQTFDYFEPFFKLTAKAIAALGSRVTVECSVGDVNAALEYTRYSYGGTRVGNERPPGFPIEYDRIHLSNIPDYIGGHMSTVIYCLPVLKAEPHAHVTSTCLLNPPLWSSAEDYISEYLLLPDLMMLEKATLLRLCPGQERVLADFLPMCEFINWQIALPKDQKLPYKSLLPRQDLNRWLFQVFFHLAIPAERVVHSMARINTPLNLTAFIRLLVRLVEIGYPAHWVGAVVDDILDNKVFTNTRIPEGCPVRSRDLKREWPRLALSTKPFIPEMETLLATWARILPFGVATETNKIPRPEEIYEYKFKLEKPLFRDEFVSVLALVFYPETALEKLLKSATSSSPSSRANSQVMIRDVLSGKGIETTEKKRMRDNVWIVSTFWWDHKKREARLRVKEGWIENMKRDERWVASLFRTDDWTPCTYPTSLRGGNLAKRAVRWVDSDFQDMT